MTDRPLRDELERLQVEVKGLEQELGLEHAARFLEKRSELQRRLGAERVRLRDLERQGATADSRFAELTARVDALTSRLHAAEQRRLSALPLLLIIAAGATGLSVFDREARFDVLGMSAALVFGLLFGTRFFAWATGQGVELPKETARIGVFNRPAMFSAIFGGVFGAAALLGGFVHGLILLSDQRSFFLLSAVTQLAAVCTLLLGLRVYRLNRGGDRDAGRSGLVLAICALLVLGVVAASWVPEMSEGLWNKRFTLALVTALPPLLPTIGMIVIAVRPDMKPRWPVVVSFLCALGAIGLCQLSSHLAYVTDSGDAFVFPWAAAQLAVLGAAMPKSGWGRAAPAAVAVGIVLWVAVS